jgi:hypothetical protein
LGKAIEPMCPSTVPQGRARRQADSSKNHGLNGGQFYRRQVERENTKIFLGLVRTAEDFLRCRWYRTLVV